MEPLEQGTIVTLLSIVVGGVIVPVVGGLKKTVIVNWIKPEFITFVLAGLSAWGLLVWLDPVQLITPMLAATKILTLALATTGATSLVYRTVK